MTRINNWDARANTSSLLQVVFMVLLYLLLGSTQIIAAAESAIPQDSTNDPSVLHQTNGSFDFGIGIGGADIPENISVGWDFLAGYEWLTSGNWRMGAQLHFLNGSSFGDDTSFQSFGMFITARPENEWLQWLQFKTGIVSDDYSTTIQVVTFDPYPFYTWQKQKVSWSGTGAAIGAGIVFDRGDWSLHALDIEQHFVAGRSFNTYTISVAVLLQLR